MRVRRWAKIVVLRASVALLALLVPAWHGARAASGTPADAPAADGATGAIEAARREVADQNLPSAIAHLAAYVAAHPKDEAPAIYLGDLYYRASEPALAETTYLAVLKEDPNSRDVHDRLGGIYAAMDRPQDAIAQFSLSLPLTSAYGHLVQIHRKLGDLSEFEESYVDAVRASPFDPAALFALGAIYSADHRSADAVSLLLRAANIEPRSCPVLSELGGAYLDEHDPVHALTYVQRCLAIDPADYASLVDLSDAYLDLGDRDADALTTLQHAVAVDPDRPEAYVNLGYIKDNDGDWNGAVADYLRSVSIDPFERDAYVDLGFDYMSHQLYSLAEAALLKGLSVSPDDGRLHYVLGLTYMRQGKRDLARAEYRRATAGNEPDVVRAAAESLAGT